MSIQTESRFNRVAAAASKASERLLTSNIQRLAEDAKSSIDISDQPSAPGTPPHSRGGSDSLPAAIDFMSGPWEAISGPRESVVGRAGELHEFGLSRGGVDYGVREFMGPALDRAVPRFLESFAGSIGE